MTTNRIYPLDEVGVLDAGSDEPVLVTINVTASTLPVDASPLAIDIPGRCRLLFPMELWDALIALMQRARGAVVSAGRTVH